MARRRSSCCMREVEDPMCRRATAEEIEAVFGRGSGGSAPSPSPGALLGSGMKALAEPSSSAESSPRTSPRASAQLSRPSADSSRSIGGDPLSPGRTNLSLKSLSEIRVRESRRTSVRRRPLQSLFWERCPRPRRLGSLPTLNLSALGSKRTLIDPLASPRVTSASRLSWRRWRRRARRGQLSGGGARFRAGLKKRQLTGVRGRAGNPAASAACRSTCRWVRRLDDSSSRSTARLSRGRR